MQILHICLNAIEFLSLFIAIGAIICRLWIFPSSFFEQNNIRTQWKKILTIGLYGIGITSLCILFIRTMEMSSASTFDTVYFLKPVLLKTHYGHILIIRMMLLILAGFTFFWINHHRQFTNTTAYTLFLIMIGIIFTYSATSHAARAGDFTLDEFVDSLHIFSGLTWGGSIIMMSIIIFPNLIEKFIKNKIMIATLMNRLSIVCTYALCGVLISGIYNAWRLLGSFQSFINTEYGNILLTKLFFVTLLIILGTINHFVLVPHIRIWASDKKNIGYPCVKKIMITISAEAIIICIIIILTAILINGIPPALMMKGVSRVKSFFRTPSSLEYILGAYPEKRLDPLSFARLGGVVVSSAEVNIGPQRKIIRTL